MEVRKKLARPSRKTILVAALLFVTIVAASLLGSTFDQRGEGEALSLRTRTEVPRGGYDDVADTVSAASAADSAKASAVSSIWETVFSRTEGAVEEDVAESVDVAAVISHMVVFTAELRLEVEDVDSALDAISIYAVESGGFVAGVSTTEGEGGIIAIRVPQETFYEAIREIERLGEVKEKEVKGEDITEDYVDLDARLRNLRSQEERLLEILGMCVDVEEMLKVEKELERVRGGIEGLTGEMRYIEGRVELATITVSLEEAREETQDEERARFPQVDWWAPVFAGLQALFTIAQGLIAMAVVLVPFAAVGLPAYHIYKRSRSNPTDEDPPNGHNDDA
jgi:hypothetical protein